MRNTAVVGVWALLIAVGAWIGFVQTPVQQDLGAFLPAGGASAEQQLLEQVRQGPAATLLLVALQGLPADQLVDASRELRQRLEASGRFATVQNGEAGLSDDILEQLFEQRYLLSPVVTAERFSPAQLHAALEQRLDDLSASLSPLPREWLARDATGEFLHVLEAWQPAEGPARHAGVWVSPGHDRALLLLQPHAGPLDLPAQALAIRTIRAAAAELDGVELLLAGPGAFALQAAETTRQETQRLTLLASLAVILILLLAYRSIRPVVICAFPVLAAVVAGAAAVGLLFGTIHGITLAFGITLIGVTLDYPIHLFSHLHGESAARTMRRIWPTLRLSVLSTAIGYGVLATTQFEGLTQLGVFAVAGLLAAAATTRWLLPALIPLHWSAPPVHSLLPRRRLPDIARWVPVAVAALVTVALWSDGLRWEDDLGALSPVPASAVQLDRELREQLGVAEPTTALLLTSASADEALRRSELLRPRLQALVEQGWIDGFEMAADLFPSAATQRERQALLPTAPALRQALQPALTELPFRADAFEPFVEEVAAARTAAPLQPEALAASPLGLRLTPLLNGSDGQWHALIALQGLREGHALAAWVRDAGEADLHFVDMRSATGAIVGAFRGQALNRLAWGLAAIAVLLAIGLGSARRAGRHLVPVLLALATTIALLLLLGERLSLFHLIALTLVAGLGIDYSLFFGRGGVADEQRLTRRALAICAVSSIAVFGILGLSEIAVLSAIGKSVALGALASFVIASLMRPSAVCQGRP